MNRVGNEGSGEAVKGERGEVRSWGKERGGERPGK